MPTIRGNGVSLYYEQHGAGPDLVLIGGLSADHTVWAMVCDALAARFRVLLFDNRGVGQSDAPPGPYSLAMMADDTVALLDALGIRRAAIVGHSMGGAILQQCCIAHPARVARAVICASAARIPTASRRHIESVVQMQRAGVAPALILATAFPWIFGAAFLEDETRMAVALANLLNTPYPQSLAAFTAQAAACTSADLRPLLPRIVAQTLVVAGREDLLTPLGCAEEIHRGIPGAMIAVMEACGHMVPLERPELFCATVQAFCATEGPW